MQKCPGNGVDPAAPNGAAGKARPDCSGLAAAGVIDLISRGVYRHREAAIIGGRRRGGRVRGRRRADRQRGVIKDVRAAVGGCGGWSLGTARSEGAGATAHSEQSRRTWTCSARRRAWAWAWERSRDMAPLSVSSLRTDHWRRAARTMFCSRVCAMPQWARARPQSQPVTLRVAFCERDLQPACPSTPPHTTIPPSDCAGNPSVPLHAAAPGLRRSTVSPPAHGAARGNLP